METTQSNLDAMALTGLLERDMRVITNCGQELQTLKDYVTETAGLKDLDRLELGYRLGIMACFINDIQTMLKDIVPLHQNQAEDN